MTATSYAIAASDLAAGLPLAIDALDVTISPQAIKAAGYVGVLHYTRNLTTARANALIAAGLGVGTIFEAAADESLGGAAQGAADGASQAALLASLGQSHGSLHVVNLADFKPTASQLPTIEAYYQAYIQHVAAWQYGGYGTGFVINGLVAAGLPGKQWQNAEDDGPAGGGGGDPGNVPGDVVVPGATLYQRVSPTLHIPGASYDEDVVLHPVNWWDGSPAPLPPTPPPPPHPAPAPSPIPPAHRNIYTPLTVDGVFGPQSTRAEQFVSFNGMTSACDGIFGINSKRSMQAHLGVAADGIIGPVTVRALQTRVGSAPDGIWGPATTRALQTALNQGRY